MISKNIKSNKPFFIEPINNRRLPKKAFLRMKKRFFKIFYFSPKKREMMKSGAFETKEKLQNIWIDKDNPLFFSKNDRQNIIDWTAIFGKMDRIIRNGEEFTLSHKLIHKRFTVYKHRRSKAIIIKTRYFKVSEKQNKVCNLLFSSGLPKPFQEKIGKMIREEVPKNEWTAIDKGSFYEKFIDFFNIIYTFKGNLFKLKIYCRITGKPPYNYRFSLKK